MPPVHGMAQSYSEGSGEEFCIGSLEVFVQKGFAGIGIGTDDGDDAAEFAVGGEVADPLACCWENSPT